MKRGGDHVMIKGRMMICEHCGDRQEIMVPQRVTSVIAITKAFISAHEDCEKPATVPA